MFLEPLYKLIESHKKKTDELYNFKKLRKKAFSVDSDGTSGGLKNILAQRENWKLLYNWHPKISNTINWNKISEAFELIADAGISKKEFRNIISTAKPVIDAYVDTLEYDIKEIKSDIGKHYDNFVKKTGILSFIFENEQIKNLIIDKLLLGNE